jgi:hypothetical protein
MKHPKVVELRACDGAYVVGKVLDPDRLRVLDSNLVPIGETLIKMASMSWSEAVRDTDWGTVLSPFELVSETEVLGEEEEVEDPLVRDVLLALGEEEEFLRRAHQRVDPYARRLERALQYPGRRVVTEEEEARGWREGGGRRRTQRAVGKRRRRRRRA